MPGRGVALDSKQNRAFRPFGTPRPSALRTVPSQISHIPRLRELGAGPSELLAAGYRAERLKGSDAADVQNCLLSAWAGAQSMALFAPENIALMVDQLPPERRKQYEIQIPP